MTLDQVSWPAAWQTVPLWSLFQRVKDVGHPNEQMLSVYRDHGVIEKESRDDNFNKTAQNRNIYQLVDQGWLILNRMKAWQGSVGVSTFRGIVSGHYICFQPRHGNDPRFLNHLLRSPIYTAEMRRLSRGVRPSQFEIDNDLLRVLPIHLPPLTEQKAIADYLDAETARIDALITKKRRMIDLLTQRWLGELLATTAAPSEQTTGVNPWQLATDGVEGGFVPLRRLVEKSWGGDWGAEPGQSVRDLPCVRSADFEFRDLVATTGAIRSFDHPTLRTRLLAPGDLVVEKSGGGEGVPVGRVVGWRGGDAVPTNFAGALRPASGVNSDFLLLVLRAAYELGLPWLSIKQTTGLQNLDFGHYMSHSVPAPPESTQRALATRLMASLSESRDLQSKIHKQLDLLTERRQALITAAVTGELEIPGVAA